MPCLPSFAGRTIGVLATAGGLWLCGCGAKEHSSGDLHRVPECTHCFTVMTYNLGRYGLDDRDGDGQKNDPKPKEERDAVIAIIRKANPDVLAVQEMGSRAIFEEFRSDLKGAGLDYPHTEYLQRGRSEANMAVLSRFPIVARQSHTDDQYSIGPAEVPVGRGFIDIDIEVTPTYRFRLMAAHLKSKVFHSLGQTEMRRNEARLLNNHVRRALKENPDLNLIVVGDMNDSPNSAAFRELTGEKQKYLQDTRPVDMERNAWTFFDPTQDVYSRIDYILLSRGMWAEYLPESSYAMNDLQIYLASDHRPIIAAFRNSETDPALATPWPTGKASQRSFRSGQDL
jgi:endonuclease/exonuclease/phosphatase family metal-dependent hydrolase